MRHRLNDACPSFLLVAGPLAFLGLGAIGVVGSREAPTEALQVAATTAPVAAAHSMAIVNGLARGVDQAAMTAAFEAGVPVVGVPAEGVRMVARNPELRRRAHAGALCIASPYAPSARFTAGNALGRNKIVYAHAAATLVVCAEAGSGGTWEGASEAIRRRFGRVAVWTGTGAGPGNQKLVELGGVAIDDVSELLDIEAGEPASGHLAQGSLFE